MSLSDASSRLREVSLGELYRSHSDWLSSRLHRLGVTGVDDVVQETYLRIAPYQARGEVRHPKSLLLRIATNLVAEEGRRVQRQRLHPLVRG